MSIYSSGNASRLPSSIEPHGRSGKGWVCTLIGAREHYALPRALQLRGQLERFYTDAWVGRAAGWMKRGPAALRALAGRYHRDLPAHQVVGFTSAAIGERLAQSWRRPATMDMLYRQYIVAGKKFCEQVNRHLLREFAEGSPAGLIGYNTGCLETLELCRERGIPTIVNQIDAARVHEQITLQEQEKWPGWQRQAGRIPDEYFRRLEAEWALADQVVVNSPWSQQALVRQGVPPEKIVVLPLAYEAESASLGPREPPAEPCVLYVGRVVLEKGIPYLFEAARLLGTRGGVRFCIAGPIELDRQAVASAPSNVTLLGRVTREQVHQLYRQASVCVLPTMSDGFAITQLEAMAHGVPVIATPNCGEVVTTGEDGLIVPAGDAKALATAIEEVLRDPAQLRQMSARAYEKAERFGLQQYADRLESILLTAAAKGVANGCRA